jgi:hypothetical protein
MAVMSDADRNKAARIIARKWVEDGNTANFHHGDYVAAVGALDDAFENTAANLPGTAGQTIAVRLNAALPSPFSGATQSHKSLLAGVTLGIKYGFVTSGGD